MRTKFLTMLFVVGLLRGGYAQTQQNQSQLNFQASSQNVGVGVVAGDVVVGVEPQIENNSSSTSGALAVGGQGGQGGIAYLAYAPTSTSIANYPEYKVQAVSPGHAPTIWPFPTQPFYWNNYSAAALQVYNREWVDADVSDSLKKIPAKGLLEAFAGLKGKGFEWQISLHDEKLRPKSKSAFSTIVPISGTPTLNIESISSQYSWVGAINVSADRRLTIDQVIRCAVKLALKYDLDFGILTFGLNPINNSAALSPGGSWNSAGLHNNFALINAFTIGDAKVIGEPCASIYVFRKNGEHKVSSELQNLLKISQSKSSNGAKSTGPLSENVMKLYEKAKVNGMQPATDKN